MSAAVTGRAMWDAPAATRGRRYKGRHHQPRRGFLPVRWARNWWRSYDDDRSGRALALTFTGLIVVYIGLAVAQILTVRGVL